MTLDIDSFVDTNMRKDGRLVPARLQTALTLLEKLRQKPSLSLDDHLASKGSSGLQSHETFGKLAHERWNIEPINITHGRRSSSLQDWGQDLLDILRENGFGPLSADAQCDLIDSAQAIFVAHLRDILEQEPITVRIRGRSGEAIIHEVLKQAEDKGKVGDVAQYLVGAKLALRFNRDIPVYGVNKGDRKSRLDDEARLGDFEIENTVIEVAVGLPDEKHINQVAETIGNTDFEVWLLTRSERVRIWEDGLRSAPRMDMHRVVVASVEAFVGQNITEMAEFSAKGKSLQMQALIKVYNTRWVSKVGTPGIRITAE